MPITQARIVMDRVGQDQFDSISVEINDVNQVNDTINTLTSRLMMARGILQSKNQDFTVTSPTAIQQRITSTLTSVSLFLAAIAAISLIVGAVGIANSMFTSVLEKTKDIGIMKAIGAKNIDIMLIFLFNSSLLGFVGGIGGIILGVIGSSAVSGLGSSGTLGRISLSNAYFSPTLIIGAFLLSIVIGMIAGVVPAYRASRLKPVDALRYE
jgi:putative ABC transport system permease protein